MEIHSRQAKRLKLWTALYFFLCVPIPLHDSRFSEGKTVGSVITAFRSVPSTGRGEQLCANFLHEVVS